MKINFWCCFWLFLLLLAVGAAKDISEASGRIVLALCCSVPLLKVAITFKTYQASQETLGKQFRIKLIPSATFYQNIRGAKPLWWQIKLASDLLLEELAKYPPSLIVRTHIDRIVLCRKLEGGNRRASGLCDCQRGVVYLDVSSIIVSVFSDDYTSEWRRAFHHELYHLIDYRDDGQVSELPDSCWQSHADEAHAFRLLPRH